jgi:D-alanyl-D-alanine dipeptidase
MKKLCSILIAFFYLVAFAGQIQAAPPPKKPEFPLVDIRTIDPSIIIDLRYAGPNNVAGRPLYQPGMAPLVRPEVARCLVKAQLFLHRYNYSLKIWDAYRPQSVQIQLWKAAGRNNYVADPNAGAGSMHRWGVAVDATLVGSYNRPVSMPTDFDNFTPAAMWRLQGRDPMISEHLRLLQVAMCNAGFYGLPSEWWHFMVANWDKLLPPNEAQRAVDLFGGAKRTQKS